MRSTALSISDIAYLPCPESVGRRIVAPPRNNARPGVQSSFSCEKARDNVPMKVTAGKTAFITGGASGIGLGMAHAFARAGMNVVLADLRQDHIDAALEEFGRAGHATQVHAIRLDVTDRGAM